MRIAVSGAHATGKSTLLGEVAASMPGAIVEEESYVTLLAEGAGFAAYPDLAEFERLWEHACKQHAAARGRQVLFDRTPADYLAYLVALGADLAGTELMARTQRALAEVDLVVFVPIESPDRVGGGELPRLRRAVDRILREMWVDDSWGWGAAVLEVRGSPRARAEQVLSRLARVALPH